MSNSSTGRFKSKALSYVVSQTRRWVDECEKAVRHAKIAVQWGAQMALHPIYALFQASRLVSRQLQGVAYSAAKLLAAGSSNPESDTPIQHVVQLIEGLVVFPTALAPVDSTSDPDRIQHAFIPEVEHLNPFKPVESLGFWQRLRNVLSTVRQFGLVRRSEHSIVSDPPATLAPSPSRLQQLRFFPTRTPSETEIHPSRLKIQGVASLLHSHTLVLVTPGNQILDILTPTQQHQLQSRIIWEIATYAYRHKQAARRNQQVLGWAKLVLGESRSRSLPEQWVTPALRSLPERLRLLPGQILEQAAFEPFQSVWKILKKLPTHVRSLLLPSQDQLELPKLPGQTQQTLGLMLDFGLLRFWAERTHLRQLWQLQEPAWLSLGDLGGQDSSICDESVPSIDRNHPNSLTHGTEAPQSLWEQLFPTFSQLFRHLLKPLRQLWPIGHHPTPALTGSTSTGIPSGGQLTKRPKPRTSIRQALGNLDSNLRSRRTSSGAMPSQVAPIAVAKTPEGYEIEFNPNWIDVEATAVGYVKHPLEYLLEWVDQVFVWIETTAIALWAWLVQLFRSDHNEP
jgi:hypothetical protein